jgi:hypothetical protein
MRILMNVLLFIACARAGHGATVTERELAAFFGAAGRTDATPLGLGIIDA